MGVRRITSTDWRTYRWFCQIDDAGLHLGAAVPCYRLRKLHRRVARDLPAPKNMIGTWKEIGAILRRQQKEPDYQYRHPLPDPAHPAVLG